MEQMQTDNGQNINQVMVSVILPVFNAGEGTELDQSIRSILEQSFSAWELIICDDGSTDRTWERLQRWKKEDSRIILLRNETNQGASAARNRCIKQAKGRFVALMDADDISHQDRFSRQLEYLIHHTRVDFVGTRGAFFCEKLGDLSQQYWYVPQPDKKDFLMTLPFVHASLMFRREVLEKIGGYSEEKTVLRSEDYDMLMRAYAMGHTGYNLSESLYYIRLDKATYQRRKYRYRWNECFVKLRGFMRLHLMPRGILYAVKPLIVGLIPIKLLNKLKKKYYKT